MAFLLTQTRKINSQNFITSYWDSLFTTEDNINNYQYKPYLFLFFIAKNWGCILDSSVSCIRVNTAKIEFFNRKFEGASCKKRLRTSQLVEEGASRFRFCILSENKIETCLRLSIPIRNSIRYRKVRAENSEAPSNFQLVLFYT